MKPKINITENMMLGLLDAYEHKYNKPILRRVLLSLADTLDNARAEYIRTRLADPPSGPYDADGNCTCKHPDCDDCDYS